MSAAEVSAELHALARVAIDMRRTGVPVDDVVRKAQRLHLAEFSEIQAAEFRRLVPDPKFNLGTIGTSGSLKILFFQEFGLEPLERTEFGAPVLNARSLQDFACRGGHVGEVATAVFGVRKAGKLITTFLDGLPVAQDGRVHPAWKVWGALTGRWACSRPNMQQFPKSKNVGKFKLPNMRELFVAPPGWVFVCADYDKLELRIIAIFANDEPLLAAFEAGTDLHTANALDLFGPEPDAKRAKFLRDLAKREVYGFNYGARAETIYENLKPEFPALRLEGVAYSRKRWFAAHPRIPAWHRSTLAQARQDMAIRVPGGTRVEEFFDGRIDENKVINFPVQGFGARLTNRATITLDTALKLRPELGHLCLQVHDELVVLCPTPHVPVVGAMIKEAMEQPIEFGGKDWVFPVELSVGPSWGQKEKLVL